MSLFGSMINFGFSNIELNNTKKVNKPSLPESSEGTFVSSNISLNPHNEIKIDAANRASVVTSETISSVQSLNFQAIKNIFDSSLDNTPAVLESINKTDRKLYYYSYFSKLMHTKNMIYTSQFLDVCLSLANHTSDKDFGIFKTNTAHWEKSFITDVTTFSKKKEAVTLSFVSDDQLVSLNRESNGAVSLEPVRDSNSFSLWRIYTEEIDNKFVFIFSSDDESTPVEQRYVLTPNEDKGFSLKEESSNKFLMFETNSWKKFFCTNGSSLGTTRDIQKAASFKIEKKNKEV